MPKQRLRAQLVNGTLSTSPANVWIIPLESYSAPHPILGAPPLFTITFVVRWSSWCFLGTPSTPISLSPLLNSTQDKWRGEPFKESLERVKYFAPPPPMTHFKVRFAVAAAVPDIGSAASHRELTPSGHPSPSAGSAECIP